MGTYRCSGKKRNTVLKRKLDDAEDRKTKYLALEVEHAVNQASSVAKRQFVKYPKLGSLEEPPVQAIHMDLPVLQPRRRLRDEDRNGFFQRMTRRVLKDQYLT